MRKDQVDRWSVTKKIGDMINEVRGGVGPVEPYGERTGEYARKTFAQSKFEEASAEALAVLLAEIQAAVKHRRDSTRVLETKAISVITLALALLAFAASFKSAVIFTSLLGILAIVLVSISIIFAISAIIPVRPRSKAPYVLDYLDPTCLREKHALARLLADLIVDWELYCADLARILRFRTARLTASYVTILPALLLVLVVAIYTGRIDNGPGPSVGSSPGASASPTATPGSSVPKAPSSPSGTKGPQKAAQAKHTSPKPVHT